MSNRTFSLIEFLLIVTILLVLFSLLLPSLRRAIVSAQRVECSSTLKKIGILYSVYENDFNRFVPAGYGTLSSGPYRAYGRAIGANYLDTFYYTGLLELVLPFGKIGGANKDIGSHKSGITRDNTQPGLTCPTDSPIFNRFIRRATLSTKVGASSPAVLGYYNISYSANGYSGYEGILVTDPSRFFLLTDKSQGYSIYYFTNTFHYGFPGDRAEKWFSRHQGGVNALFRDLHVVSYGIEGGMGGSPLIGRFDGWTWQ